MPKTANQRLKLFLLRDYLLANTDADHAVTLKDMIAYLESNGVEAERKSLYENLETLEQYGMDIQTEKRDRTVSYRVVSREFEVSELKLLVDAVQSSRFITEKKSGQLIKKLEALCSRHEGYDLERQLLVARRIKNMNECIYYNVDKLHLAIKNNERVSFRYFDYAVDKRKVFRRDGKTYEVSPFSLMWDNENYYLIAYDAEAAGIRHYRVDKMDRLERLTGVRREGSEVFDKLDVGNYSSKVFSMFGGVGEKVCLEFAESLVGVVFDRFGKDIVLMKSEKPGFFRFEEEVVVSPQFFGWLFSFGDKAGIIYPQKVKDDFRDYLDSVRKIY